MNFLRYCSSSLLLLVTAVGLALGGIWQGLGLFVVLGIAIVDAFLPKDFSSHPLKSSLIGDAVLMLYPLCFLVLYAVYADRLNLFLSEAAMGNVLAAFLIVSFVTAITFLPIIHELMHRTGWVFAVGTAFVALFGAAYMSNSHLHVHHVDTNTPDDTETPVRGENVWRFILRAVKGQHQKSWKIEKNIMQSKGIRGWSLRNRILQGAFGLLVGAMLFTSISGVWGLPFYIATIGAAMSLQAIYSYIEHYGLVRVPGSPIELRHAWNHLNPLGRALSVEIASHSAHHVDPDIPYYQLSMPENAPNMPGVYTSFILSLIPWVWEKYVAQPRLKHWDNHFANSQEQQLAREANRRAGWSDWIS